MTTMFKSFSTNLDLQHMDYLYLTELRNSIYDTVGLDFTESDLIGILLSNVRERSNYLKIISLSQHLVISLTEVEKLTSMLPEERSALEWLKNTVRRNMPIKDLIEDLRYAVEINDTENLEHLSDKIHKIITAEYNKKYLKNKLGAGMKKLIIKSAIAYLVLNEAVY